MKAVKVLMIEEAIISSIQPISRTGGNARRPSRGNQAVVALALRKGQAPPSHAPPSQGHWWELNRVSSIHHLYE
jgi:hypothetical protein